MERIQLEYDVYKSHVLESNTKTLFHQHIITSTGGIKYYFLFAPDSEAVLYVSYINESTSTGQANIADYIANYASSANKNIKETSFRSDRFRRQYSSESGNNTEACTNTEWTEFYDVDFGSEKKYFSELVVKCDNLDKIRIRLDGEIVIQTIINSLKKVLVDDDGITMKDIDVSYVNNISTLYLDLNYQKGSRIQIMQQRRSGSGDLTMKGYILSYVERI